MTDLHLHTTASDGRFTPHELVSHAVAAGLRTIAVTDHDTTASVSEVRVDAEKHGIEAVPGIEITAVEDGRDVHMLGYFIEPSDIGLAAFLVRQRESRVARIEAIGEKLAELGMTIDVELVLALARSQPGRSVGRPQVARALAASGYVRDVQEAFNKWLGVGRPAYIPRIGPSPETVIAVIHMSGGLASLAHPGRTGMDERIGALRDEGLDALEVYHPDHDEEQVERYAQLARDLDLLMTGGSDSHGDANHGLPPGGVTLPDAAWHRLSSARSRHARHP